MVEYYQPCDGSWDCMWQDGTVPVLSLVLIGMIIAGVHQLVRYYKNKRQEKEEDIERERKVHQNCSVKRKYWK
jgi:hypothetical protein